MKKSEKIWVTVLAIAAIIFIIVLLANRLNGNKVNDGDSNSGPEEFVEKQEDGTKINISNKIKETKKLGGLEISGIAITEKNNLAQLLGTIKNTSGKVDGGYTVKIIVVSKSNQQIIDMLFDIPELKPGQSLQLDCSATFDYSNAYDVKFEKM